MKIFILLIALVCVTLSAFTQQTEKPTKTKEEYLKIAKALKTTGWVLIDGGTIAVIVGTNISAHKSKNPMHRVLR